MAIQESGFYYPNKMARLYIKAIEDTVGPEAMKAIYGLAGVPLKHYPPPDNFAKEFDFAYYSAISAALEKMYGLRGWRGLAVHAGRVSFGGGLAEFGGIVGVSELAFKTIPLGAKVKVGLRALAETFLKSSDVIAEVGEEGDHFIYTIRRCPNCWGRTSERPVCYSALGVIDAGLHWVSGGKNFPLEEVACCATGDEACVFHVGKEPASQ
jgi:hypothetical protein